MKQNQDFGRPYNSRIIDAYVKLIKNFYPSVDVGSLLLYAGMEEFQVEDQTHWFNQEQVDLFYEKRCS